MTLHPISATTKMKIGNRADFFLKSNSHPSFQTITYRELEKAIFIQNFGYIIDRRSIELDLKEDLDPNTVIEDQWVYEDHRNHLIIKSKGAAHYKVNIKCGVETRSKIVSPFCEVKLPESCIMTSSWYTIGDVKQIGKKENKHERRHPN